MTKNDKPEFAKAITSCYMAFDKQPSEEQMRIYFDLLSGYQVSDVCSAFRKHITDSDRGRFFPKVADIVYQIEKQNKPQDLKQAAELEWSKVLAAASKGIKPANCSEISVGALSMIGGVSVVGYAEPAELARLRKYFFDCYESLSTCSTNQVPSHIENALEIKQQKQQVAKRD